MRRLRPGSKFRPQIAIAAEVQQLETRILLAAVLVDTTPTTTLNASTGASTGNIVLATFTSAVPTGGLFANLNVPGSTGSIATGVSGGQVFGYYFDGSGTHGYVYNGSSYTTYDDPSGSQGTYVEGISGSNVYGSYETGNVFHGFEYNGSKYSTLDPLQSTYTEIFAVSGSNAVGCYQDSAGTTHGLLYNGSTYITLDPPGSTKTIAEAVSGSNVVGYYETSNGGDHGFLYNGSYTTLDIVPGSNFTQALGVDGSNVVGFAGSGFLYNGSTYTTISPNGARYTEATAVSGGNVAGYYMDSSFVQHGFLFSGSTLTTLDPPGATFTQPTAISGSSVVGYYQNGGNYQSFDYITDALVSDFTYNVNWGGTLAATPTKSLQLVSQTPTGSTWEVIGSATYATAGNYTPSVTVADAVGNNIQTSKVDLNVQAAASATPTGLSPSQLRLAYGFNSVSFYDPATGNKGMAGDGTHQTIAIVEAYDQTGIISDVQAFNQQFGISGFGGQSPATLNFVAGTPGVSLGPEPTADSSPWGFETRMDVEWAHALAPGANIIVVEAATDSIPDLVQAVDTARNIPGVSVVSMSFGWNESANESTYDQYFTTPAGHTGVTFVAATGDTGTPAAYPAASPNVLAVGGAMFMSPLDANGDYVSETAWNTGNYASGGGLSQYEQQPGYQQSALPGTANRATPDVSFDAGGTYGAVSVYDSENNRANTPWVLGTGTSLSAPGWASLIAIADQGSSLLGNGTLNGAGTLSSLYSIANGPGGLLAFHDVTTGNNSITQGANQHAGNSAGTGYDLVTGLGTPNATYIAAGLSGNIDTPTPIVPANTINTITPTFQWTAVSGALGYQLIVTDLLSNAAVLNVSVKGSTNYTPVAGLLAFGHSYSWTIQAYPVLAGASPASSPVTFNVGAIAAPIATSPINFVTSTTTTPTFTWVGSANAAYYSVVIFDQTGYAGGAFPPPTVFAPQVNSTSYTTTTPLIFGHAYDWYVYANVSINGTIFPGPSSTLNSFRVSQTAAPSLLGPASGSTVNTATPTLQWTSVTGAAYYNLTLIDTTISSLPMATIQVNGTSVTMSPALTVGHTYQWFVYGENNTIGPSGTSPPATFTVGTASGASLVNTPILSSPANNSSVPPITNINGPAPTFSWSAVTGAVGYNLYIQDASYAGGTVYAFNGLSVTTYAPPISGSQPFLFGATSFKWWVTAYDSQGNVSAVPPANSVTFALPNLTTLGPSGPVTNTYRPVFQWQAFPGATYYAITITDTSDGTSSFPTQNIGNTTFTAPLPLADNHNYTWTLTAMGSTGTALSATSTVAFSEAVPGGGNVTLGVPLPATVAGALTTTTPTFSWLPVAGATYYELFILDPQYTFFSSVVAPIATTGTSFTPGTGWLQPGHTYIWWVRACDSAGDISQPSRHQDFNVSTPGTGVATPTISGPAGLLTSYAFSFQWSAIANASGYFLTVIDETKGVPALSYLGITSNSDTPATNAFQFPNGDSYRWYVSAYNAAGTFGTAAVGAFSLAVPAPPAIPAPTPQSPVTGDFVSTSTPKFQWTATPGATSYTLFIISIGIGDAFFGIPVSTNSYTPPTPLINGQKYKWNVSAHVPINGMDDQSPSSEYQTFTVSAPGAPVLSGPSGTISSVTPTFQWSPVTGAVGYELTLLDTTGTTPVTVMGQQQFSNATTSFTPLAPLVDKHSYQWYVQAFDNLGDISAVQAISFSINVNLVPLSLSFKGGVNTTNPTFQWSSVAGAAGYFLTVTDTTHTPNVNVLDGLSVPASSSPTITYTIGTPLTPGDSYVWSVKAYDQFGNIIAEGDDPDPFGPPPSKPPPVPIPNPPGSSVPRGAPKFSWTESDPSAVEYYTLSIIDVTHNEPTNVASILPISTTYYTVPVNEIATATSNTGLADLHDLVINHEYTWQVEAWNGAGASGYSTAVDFVLTVPAPTLPATGPLVDSNSDLQGAFNIPFSNLPAASATDPDYQDQIQFQVSAVQTGGTLTVIHSDNSTTTVGSAGATIVASDKLTFTPASGAVAGTSLQAFLLTATNGITSTVVPIDVFLAAPLVNTTPLTTLNAFVGTATGNTVLATFTDVNPSPTATEFTPTAIATNSDGTMKVTINSTVQFVSQSGGTSYWEVIGDPAFAQAGQYTVSVTVADTVAPGPLQTANPIFNVSSSSPPPAFEFTGEYAVATAGNPTVLASITQSGAQLTLTGTTTPATIVTNPGQLLAGGAVVATYSGSVISFTSGAFAGETWTKLDLPTDFTNQGGAPVHIYTSQDGTSLTFVNKLLQTSSGSWIDPTHVKADNWGGPNGEVGTLADGKISWAVPGVLDPFVWSENLSLTWTQNGSAKSTSTATTSPIYVADYVDPTGKAVHLVQTGTNNVVVIDANNNMLTGAFDPKDPTHSTFSTDSSPGDVATISGDLTTITWTNSSKQTVVWTQSPRTSAITVTDYTNQFGVPVHLIQLTPSDQLTADEMSQLAFVDALGRTRLGSINGNMVQNPAFAAGVVGTLSANSMIINWSNGYVWTPTNPVPLSIKLTDANGTNFHVQLTSATTLIALDPGIRIDGSFDYTIQGRTATRQDDTLVWSNGDVWGNVDFNALNALFEMAIGYP